MKPTGLFEAYYDWVSSANPGAFNGAYADLGEGKLDSVSAPSPEQLTLLILPDLCLG